ncbi:T9SS type A sorting domain-containing protein [Flavobacterium sp.]
MLYPNPVETKFFISAPNETITSVEIYNSLGKLIKKQDDGSRTINISD